MWNDERGNKIRKGNLVVEGRGTIGIEGEEEGLQQLKNFHGGGGSYRRIKLLEHGLKVLEKILDKRLRQIITIDRIQFVFSPSKGTADAI